MYWSKIHIGVWMTGSWVFFWRARLFGENEERMGMMGAGKVLALEWDLQGSSGPWEKLEPPHEWTDSCGSHHCKGSDMQPFSWAARTPVLPLVLQLWVKGETIASSIANSPACPWKSHL